MAIQLYVRKEKGKYQKGEHFRWSKDINKAELLTKTEWARDYAATPDELVPVEIRELPVAPKKGK